jgi:predicted phage terminase large subunit-like protein
MAEQLLQETVLRNRWIPHCPTPKQAYFLTLPHREALFGGAAGGGKSDSLLMAALQYVDTPGYAAMIFRRTYADLSLPGAIMDRSKDWLSGTPAKWNDNTKTWTFPSKATLTFAYLEHENDKYRYQGSELQFVGFDELTQFPETVYRYLFSRIRRLQGAVVPLRMRGATNPGGAGHEWVMQRFLIEREPERRFVFSTLDDNPHLDRDEYLKSLSELDPYTRAQLLNGDWFARPPGTKFQRHWFPIVDQAPAAGRTVRFWDLAATEKSANNGDPDWTCGALVSTHEGRYYIRDMRRDRATPAGVESLIKQTAELDGKSIPIWMEQEPGSSGVKVIDDYARRVLAGWTFRGVRSTGPKELRANPVSSAAEAGNVLLVRGAWNTAFLDEAEAFPGGQHDDQIDAVSGAVAQLTGDALPYGWLTGDEQFRDAVLGPETTDAERIAARKRALGIA